MKHHFFIPTPLGELTACEENECLTVLCWERISPEKSIYGNTPLIRETTQQIEAYFEHRLTHFTLPYQAEGTGFQKQVWKEICNVPYGSTWSYQELAQHCENGKACQAVGTACGKNPLVLIIPCHRIINKNGSTGNYHGGAERKIRLLEHEKRTATLFPLSVINL